MQVSSRNKENFYVKKKKAILLLSLITIDHLQVVEYEELYKFFFSRFCNVFFIVMVLDFMVIGNTYYNDNAVMCGFRYRFF